MRIKNRFLTGALAAAVALTLWFGPAGADDYTTPNTGATYTLDDIVSASGGLTVASNGTSYTLKGNLEIAPLDTLVISPGQQMGVDLAPFDPDLLPTQIREPGYSIVIRGTLTADGLSTQPIVLVSNFPDERNAWRGIYAMGADASLTLRHASLAHSVIGVLVRGSEATIEHCTFTDIYYTAIGVNPGSRVTIRNNTIDIADSVAGLSLDMTAEAVVEDNIISGAGAGIISNSNPSSVRFVGNALNGNRSGIVSDSADAAAFEANIIDGGEIGVQTAGTTSAAFKDNVFSNQSLAAMTVEENAAPSVRGSNFGIAGAPAGVFIFDDSQPNLGDGITAGGNTFLAGADYDVVNFSPLAQTAIGNTWSQPTPKDGIWDLYDDTADADGSGEVSGPVVIETAAEVDDWILF